MGKSRSQSGKRKLSVVNLALWVLYVILAAVAIALMLKYHVLAFDGLNHLIIAVAAGVALVTLFLSWLKRLKGLTSLVLILGILVSGMGVMGMKSVIDLSDKVTAKSSYTQYGMAVVVRANDEVTDVGQLQEVTAPTANDGANIEDLIKKIEQEKGVTLSAQEVASYVDAYKALMNNEVKAIVLNSAFESIIAADDPDYKDKIKTLYTSTIRQEITLSQPDAETASSEAGDSSEGEQASSEEASGEQDKSDQEAKQDQEGRSQAVDKKDKNKKIKTDADIFNIYVSGIDTYGDVTTVSRSDVNIIITVNRKTKQVLLTTTPRDSYVRIAGGGNNQYDKLTHAGIYGVNASIQTLENLYGIDINYYARLNFTSFMNLIDLLGGVEVYNDQAFTSHHGKYDFPVGNITLDSNLALAFVRERYSLKNGDDDRGRNQEKVIAAIIKKLTSTDALKNAQGILNSLGNSVQTNMDLTTLMNLTNDQLASKSQYQVISQALEGAGSTGLLPSYAMPTSRLYMVQINPSSLASVKAAMQATMEGGS